MPRDRAGSGGSNSGGGHRPHNQMVDNHHHQQHDMDNSNVTHCCVPTGCDLYDDCPIPKDDLHGVTRVVCNNEQCPVGQFMHRECFEAWEQTVLSYLRSTGRARSWSEKQRLQNLWTKKGYDLAFKACGCKCGKGHLRKDLNWIEPPPKNGVAGAALEDRRKRNRKKNKNERPGLYGSPLTSNFNGGNVCHLAVSMPNPPIINNSNREGRPMLRLRSNSMSSTGSTSGSSPPSSSGVCDSPRSPSHLVMHVIGAGNAGGIRRRSSTKLEPFFSEKPEMGGSIFFRRSDYSSFNSLPRHKINSYHIKMEEDGNCGNDETRCFVLSNLAAAHVARVTCVVCQCSLPIFDQYPLIDGTFFLSPRQHSKSCLQVKTDVNQHGCQYLCAVCMGCLEGWSAALRCRYCAKQWRGTSLILGTMYSYDIFAADPCCIERLKCNRCHKLVLLAEQRCSYFSDYSTSLSCPHCGHVDHHFVKGLGTYYRGLE